MNTCAIYARVSTRDQADHGTSLDTQTDACRAYALKQGYTVLREIAEDASGATLHRAGLDEVRELARSGAISAVVFYHLDRLSRDDTNTLLLARELTNCGVALDCATMRIEDSPTGKFLFSVLAAQASLERAMILERTTRGKVRAAQNGRVLATSYTAYGYRYVQGESRLEIYEPEAEWVRRMFTWVGRDAVGLHEVTRRLNGAKVRTRTGNDKTWSRAVVGRIMASPIYKGEYLYNKRNNGKRRDRDDWVTIAVPAIVSPAEWQAAQDNMARARAHISRNVKHDYLLRGLLWCSVCGYRLYGRQVGQPPIRHRYYACDTQNQLSRPRPQKCGVRLVRADRAEALVWAEVVRQLTDDAIVKEWATQRRDEREGLEHSDRIALITRRLAALTDESERILDAYQGGDIERGVFSGRMDAIKRRRAVMQEELREAESRYLEWQRASQPAQDWRTLAASLREMLPHAEYEDKRAFMVGIDLRGMWHPDRTLVVYGLPQVVTLRV